MLLDEDVPRKLAGALSGHAIQTVVSMQWGGHNGALLDLIARTGFEVFVTGDKNMPYQHHLAGRPFAVVILSAINWPVIRPHVARIAAAVAQAQAGTVHLVDCGQFRPRGSG